MSKGSNSSTTNQSSSVTPNPQAMAAYSALMSRAGDVSQTPWSPFTGQEVAPINERQLFGANQQQMEAMGYAPYAGVGAYNINQAGQGVSANDISQYMDPYTSQVINATQADFDTQNKRADTITKGNAAASNALGGNRVGVAQALTQEGQERVQAPVIAGLRSAGFQSAEQMANQQKSRQLQSGQIMSDEQMKQAQGQFAYGTAEQQTKQAQDTQQMTDYYTQQGYPFATAQWLAGIVLGTGPQMGSSSTGTSTTQGAQPNQWLQGAGLGLSALAAFSDERLKENIKEVGRLHDGQKIYKYNFKGDPTTHVGLISQEVEKHHPEAVGKVAGFGTVDYDEATKDAVKRWSGGAIHGFAEGGTPYGPGTQGWVPTIGKIGGTALQNPGVHPPKTDSQSQPDMSKMGTNIGKIGKGLWDNMPTDYGSGYGDYGSNWGGQGLSPEITGAYFRGGSIPISTGFAGGGHVYGYAGRGRVEDDDVIDATDLGPVNVGGNWDRGSYDTGLGLAGQEDPTVASNAGVLKNPDVPASSPGGFKTDAFNGINTSGGRGFKQDESDMPASATSFDAGVGPSRITIGAAGNQPTYVPGTADKPKSGMGGFNPFGLSDEARQGLISMGLGMMANRRGGKGSFLAGVGEGGEQGMTTYASARAATAAKEALERKEAFEREKFNRPYSEMTEEQKVRFRETQQQNQFMRMKAVAEQQERQRAHDLAVKKPLQWTDGDGNPHMALPRPNKDGTIDYWPVDMTTGQMASSPLGGSLKEGANRAFEERNQQQQPTPGGGKLMQAGYNPNEGVIPSAAKMSASGGYNYSKPLPFTLDKGMEVPDPEPVSNKSSKNIKADAEYYLETGKLPPQARGFNPGAIAMNKYRDAVQNYASALSDSRGMTPEDMATLRRSSPETYRWIRSKGGDTVVSLGTAVRHLDTLRELQQAWNSGDTQVLNRVKAIIARQFGDASVTSLEAAASIVGAEVVKAIIGSQSGQAERDEARKLFTPLLSGAQAYGNISTVQKLLGGQLDGKERQAKQLGVSEKQFKELIGERPYEILKNADKKTEATPAAESKKQVVQRGWIYEQQADGSYKPIRKAP